MTHGNGSIWGTVGLVLVRLVVPLWVLAGAIFKLVERTPANLPSGMRAVANSTHLDLELLMRLLIGAELFAAGVMLFVPRLARAMAIFMLTCFCGILIWEMARQASKCGCFGALPIKPWQMLIVDGALLLGVLTLRPRRTPGAVREQSWLMPLAGFAAIAAVAAITAFAVPDKPPTKQAPIAVNDTNDPTINPTPLDIPNSWMAKPDVQSWVGRQWREVDLFQLMPRWPGDMDAPTRYVIFYSRTCEHCEQLFYDYLIGPLDGPVAAVEIPATPTELRGPNPWPMPEAMVEHLELPLGCHWIITSPIVLRLEGGTIACATEGEGHETCLRFPPAGS